MSYADNFDKREAKREIRKQNKLKKKGIEVNELDGSASDERSMLKQHRKEKIGNFFNTVSNARKRSFSNKMDKKIIKAETKNTIAQIEGHENVAAKNTARAMDIQIARDKPKMGINIDKSVDNSVHQVDNSSTIESTTVNKPTAKAKKVGSRKSPSISNEPKPNVEYAPLEPSVRNQGDLVKETPQESAEIAKSKQGL
jgi:hypothetical protein